MSLTTAGSSMNAAFGAVSEAGAGVPAFEVTQSGAGPLALVAVHPAGSAGTVTPSKFSVSEPAHAIGVPVGAGVGEAVGTGVGVPVGPGVGVAVAVGVGVAFGSGVGVGPVSAVGI